MNQFNFTTSQTKKSRLKVSFSRIPNNLLLNKDIHPIAKVIWAYIEGRPIAWKFSYRKIAKALGISLFATTKHIQVLKKYGFLKIKKIHNKLYHYEISEFPFDFKPEPKEKKALICYYCKNEIFDKSEMCKKTIDGRLRFFHCQCSIKYQLESLEKLKK